MSVPNYSCPHTDEVAKALAEASEDGLTDSDPIEAIEIAKLLPEVDALDLQDCLEELDDLGFIDYDGFDLITRNSSLFEEYDKTYKGK
jgi:hypothetical protein